MAPIYYCFTKLRFSEALIIQFLFSIHDTADTQRHSGNNLYLPSIPLSVLCSLFGCVEVADIFVVCCCKSADDVTSVAGSPGLTIDVISGEVGNPGLFKVIWVFLTSLMTSVCCITNVPSFLLLALLGDDDDDDDVSFTDVTPVSIANVMLMCKSRGCVPLATASCVEKACCVLSGDVGKKLVLVAVATVSRMAFSLTGESRPVPAVLSIARAVLTTNMSPSFRIFSVKRS